MKHLFNLYSNDTTFYIYQENDHTLFITFENDFLSGDMRVNENEEPYQMALKKDADKLYWYTLQSGKSCIRNLEI